MRHSRNVAYLKVSLSVVAETKVETTNVLFGTHARSVPQRDDGMVQKPSPAGTMILPQSWDRRRANPDGVLRSRGISAAKTELLR
jgi:hypothetical protein